MGSNPTLTANTMSGSTFYLYILECADKTLYTGVTVDVQRRVQEHNGSPKGARYTRARRPVVLRYAEAYPDRSSAQQAEARLKALSRAAKLAYLQARRDR